MTNDLLGIVEKLFKLHVMDSIHSSKRSILKICSMFYFEIENNVLQLRNALATHEIVMDSQLQRLFVGSVIKFRN